MFLKKSGGDEKMAEPRNVFVGQKEKMGTQGQSKGKREEREKQERKGTRDRGRSLEGNSKNEVE